MLLLPNQRKLAQHHPADIGESDGQFGLPVGAVLALSYLILRGVSGTGLDVGVSARKARSMEDMDALCFLLLA